MHAQAAGFCNALFRVAMYGHADAVEALVRARANMDRRGPGHNRVEAAQRLLKAARSGHVPAVLVLLGTRAELCARDVDGAGGNAANLGR
jgi:hypothetical protein